MRETERDEDKKKRKKSDNKVAWKGRKMNPKGILERRETKTQIDK